ncbi:hypothetical protein D8W73_17590 [Citrobacter amalonaticus]|nr:hypothetical protein [Citrobacter amalonaticus]
MIINHRVMFVFVGFFTVWRSILVICQTILKIFIFAPNFNIGEVLNNIESCEYQCVTFSILVIMVLFPN